MDEIEWIKNAKELLLFTLKIICGFEVFLLIVALTAGLNDIYINIMMVIKIGITLIAIEIVGFILLYIIYKVMYAGKKTLILDKQYIRELPKKYTPAIASLVYDLKIDVYKDYTATILELYEKKYLNMKKENDVYKFDAIDNGKNSKELNEHEQYVLRCITNKEKFDENEFKSLIIKDAQEKCLIANKKESRIMRIVLIVLSYIAILIMAYLLNKKLFWILFEIMSAMILTIIIVIKAYKDGEDIKLSVNTLYKRTSKGKKVEKEVGALKKFIHDYTLIKDREIEYIKLLDEYIPYALSLDEANMIEEYIKFNEGYRDFIYNRRAVN